MNPEAIRALRWAQYSRASTDAQDESEDRQTQDADAWADEMGVDIAERFHDQKSGRTLFADRDGGKALLAAVESGAVTAVIIWQFNRLGRDPYDIIGTVGRVLHSGCAIYVLKERKFVTRDSTPDLCWVFGEALGAALELAGKRADICRGRQKQTRERRFTEPPRMFKRSGFLSADPTGKTAREIVGKGETNIAPIMEYAPLAADLVAMWDMEWKDVQIMRAMADAQQDIITATPYAWASSEQVRRCKALGRELYVSQFEITAETLAEARDRLAPLSRQYARRRVHVS